MKFTDFRLKFRRFFRKNKKLLFIIFIIWFIIYLINRIIIALPTDTEAETTYDPHTSILDTGSTPKSVQKPIEEIIKEYVGLLNEGNYQKAFDMLSDDCKEYSFDNNIQYFMDHVYTKMPTMKEYSIQNYSNITYGNKKLFIYEVRYFDDILATGLTNSVYEYTQENITFYNGEDGLEMNVGDYIFHTDIKSIAENEYLKVDVIDKVVNYSMEEYQVKFTNRSNYTIVIADGVENEEVLLGLANETRKRAELNDIVLGPNESITQKFTFPKFVDDSDNAQKLIFSSVRVMEQYSGTDFATKEQLQSEIDNAISKFSVEVVLQ